MNHYTCEQLQKTIGNRFELVPCIGTHKARVNRGSRQDLATIDFEHGCIEARLTATWDETVLATMPGRQPDEAAIAHARQELIEEVIYDWELAGFTVPAGGALEWLPCPDQVDRKSPVYVVVVTRPIPTLGDAIEALLAIYKYCVRITIKA